MNDIMYTFQMLSLSWLVALSLINGQFAIKLIVQQFVQAQTFGQKGVQGGRSQGPPQRLL